MLSSSSARGRSNAASAAARLGLTLSSSGTGTLHGGGEAWWGYLKYLEHGEDRPRLFSLVNATDVRVERWRGAPSEEWGQMTPYLHPRGPGYAIRRAGTWR